MKLPSPSPLGRPDLREHLENGPTAAGWAGLTGNPSDAGRASSGGGGEGERKGGEGRSETDRGEPC